ncbi:hypothetical protein FB561_5847 [Kribbella amoyensis]|uniref:Intracellular septation protein A n=1 Tax=Kribbella amoyensis TaxID=996641 RepID=A0A561C0G3_9ACTN|nr:VC0807 family protein [Kribbella amoyensis]TWD84653.1 hypothetical protein FB561_5847 [Kribbella amoyensis]
MKGAARTVLAVGENVGLPIATYGALRLLGLDDIWALTGSAAVSAAVLLVQWIRTRDVSALGSLVLLRFALSLALAFVTDNARWLLVKDSLITAVIGLAALASLLLHRSFIERVRRDLSGDPEAFDRRLTDEPWFRRRHRILGVLWGAALLAEAALSTTVSLTLPIPLAVLITNLTGPAVIVGLIVLTETTTRRPLPVASG